LEADGVSWDDLHPSLRRIKAPRVSQKRRYRGCAAKGIIRIDLEDLT